jgi:4-diphosphocytidyl-2-C-methyl-D-erythritol kinase
MEQADRWVTRSYAKINLGLFVHGRMPDGYHDIETGFAYIDWSDTFRVKVAPQSRIRFSDPDIRPDETNTVVKAYRLFMHEFGLSRNYDIMVEKSIPMGAGLGGGSSNAATMLRILSKLENRNIPLDRLADTGALIGSDVPFFLSGETAIGTGRGVNLKSASIQPDAWILTVYPNFESSTAEAYHYCEPNTDHELTIASILLDTDIEEWSYLLTNDLEPSVMVQHPMIGDIKDQMMDFGAIYAAMSGSGSSVYGLFTQDFVALNAWHGFIDLGMRGNLTRPMFKPDPGIYVDES